MNENYQNEIKEIVKEIFALGQHDEYERQHKLCPFNPLSSLELRENQLVNLITGAIQEIQRELDISDTKLLKSISIMGTNAKQKKCLCVPYNEDTGYGALCFRCANMMFGEVAEYKLKVQDIFNEYCKQK